MLYEFIYWAFAFLLGCGLAYLFTQWQAQKSKSAMAEDLARTSATLLALEKAGIESKQNFDHQLKEYKERIQVLEGEANQLKDALSTVKSLHSGMVAAKETQEKAFKENEAKIKETFQALSAEVLKSNNATFLQLAEQSFTQLQSNALGELEKKNKAMADLIQPIQTNLNKLEQATQGLETKREGAYENIKTLLEQTKVSQDKLNQETTNLTRALRQPKTLGNWGEMQLKRVLEMADMKDQYDFVTQQSFSTGEGRLQPDVIVRLPGNRQIVIDAKTPLEAYLDANNATDESVRKDFLKSHAANLKNHIKALRAKNYQAQFEPSLDFVILFIPGDFLYSAALEADPGLLEEGIQNKVLVATPTSLLALLRAIAYGWNQEALARDAQKIAELGTALYKNIAVFYKHFEDIGEHLNRSVEAFNASIGSFERNLLTTARRFKELKVQTENKTIPEPDKVLHIGIAARRVDKPNHLFLE